MGHLALANYLCEYNGLDEIWFHAPMTAFSGIVVTKAVQNAVPYRFKPLNQ